jgi:hypothetical protein
MDSWWTAMPTSRVVDWGMADLRVRLHAVACGGTGFKPANPREHRRSAYPSEVIMSRQPYPYYAVVVISAFPR